MRFINCMACVAVASATPVSAATLLTDGAVQVLGNLSSNGGNTIGTGIKVGGNARLNSDQVGGRLTSASDNTPTVIVGGNLSYDNSTLQHGSVVYGGTNGSGQWTQVKTPNGTVARAKAVDFAAAAARYRALSGGLSQLTANGTFSMLYGAGTLTATSSGSNIFNLKASDLASIYSLRLAGTTGGNIIINVDAASVSNYVSFNFGSFASESVLINFYNAKHLDLQGWNLGASILAPEATTTLSGGKIEGSIVTGDLVLAGGTTINGRAFAGLAPPAPLRNTAPIPEPGSWALTIIGFGAIGVMLRRRRPGARVSAA